MILIRVWVAILCIGWVALIGWREFILREDYSAYRHAFQPLAKCSGSFQSRYDCHSSRMLTHESAEFYSYGKRFALVLLPPITLLYLLGKYRNRQEKRRVEAAREAAALRRRAAAAAEAKPKSGPKPDNTQPAPAPTS